MFRHWTHVREEDDTTAQTFRPHDYPIQDGTGRDGFAFHLDGTVTRYDGGPTGAPVKVSGRWRHVDGVLELSFPDDTPTLSYRVDAVEPERLRLTPVAR